MVENNVLNQTPSSFTPPTLTNNPTTQSSQFGSQSSPYKSDAVLVSKPKSIYTLSKWIFVMALIQLSGAFTGSALVLILNRAMTSIPGGLEFSMLKGMPVFGLTSLPGIIAFPLILFAALRVRSGSLSAWKTAMIILVTVFIIEIVAGFLTVSLVNPIYQATSIN